MYHNVQLGISIDDESIVDAISRNARDIILEDLKTKIFKNLGMEKGYSGSWSTQAVVDDIMKTLLKDEEFIDKLLDKAADKLADKVVRQKWYKELMGQKILESEQQGDQ